MAVRVQVVPAARAGRDQTTASSRPPPRLLATERPRRGDSSPRNVRVAAAIRPRNIRVAPRGGAATRPRNIHVAAAASPRLVTRGLYPSRQRRRRDSSPAGYPRRGRGELQGAEHVPQKPPRPLPSLRRRVAPPRDGCPPEAHVCPACLFSSGLPASARRCGRRGRVAMAGRVDDAPMGLPRALGRTPGLWGGWDGLCRLAATCARQRTPQTHHRRTLSQRAAVRSIRRRAGTSGDARSARVGAFSAEKASRPRESRESARGRCNVAGAVRRRGAVRCGCCGRFARSARGDAASKAGSGRAATRRRVAARLCVARFACATRGPREPWL